MATFCSLDSLPEELVLNIFEYCDIQSLGRLSSTCKKYKSLIAVEDYLWRDKSRYVLASNMSASAMEKRCKPNLSFKKRCEISKSWRAGLGRRNVLTTYKSCLPWICLDQDYLFCSKEKMLVQFVRDGNGNALAYGRNETIPNPADDVSRFAINEDEIVTAGRAGDLTRWRKNLEGIHSVNAHALEIYSVDAKDDIIITGSRDTSVKIWRAYPNDTVCQQAIDMKVRVLATAIMPSNRHFIVGTPGVRKVHPLLLYDLERAEYITKFGGTFPDGAGILSIYPECEHTFLCCGYDTTVRLWDVRSPKDWVAEWLEPYDNSLFCVKSDHNITIVSGACRSGTVYVWDKRWNACAKIYQTERKSPVYSVDFDASHLYVACQNSVVQYTYL